MREFLGNNYEKASKLSANIEPAFVYERLLENFNIALIHQAAKNLKLSNYYFEYVANLAENVEPITIKEVAGSFITNEENFYYRLEDYERILVHFFIALNYLSIKQPQEALVEFRRVETLLDSFTKLRKNKFPIIDAFRFLAAYCYFLGENYEDAKIELKKIGRLNLIKSFKNPQQILLIVSNGLAPKKVPDPSFPLFPKYIDSVYEYSNYYVTYCCQSEHKPLTDIKPLFVIDIGKMLKLGLKNRLKAIRKKIVARLIGKTTISYYTLKKKSLLGIIAALGLLSWEKPDVRSVDLLPDKVRIFYISDNKIQLQPSTLKIYGDTKYRKNQQLFEEAFQIQAFQPKIIVERLPF